jgi:hypothetical protein
MAILERHPSGPGDRCVGATAGPVGRDAAPAGAPRDVLAG